MLLNGDYMPSPINFQASREPHLGLCNNWGVELDSIAELDSHRCLGYHRVNVATTRWKIEIRDFKVHFVNVQALSFGVAKNDWTTISGYRVYAGSLRGDPPVSDIQYFPAVLEVKETTAVYFEAGGLSFYLKDITE